MHQSPIFISRFIFVKLWPFECVFLFEGSSWQNWYVEFSSNATPWFWRMLFFRRCYFRKNMHTLLANDFARVQCSFGLPECRQTYICTLNTYFSVVHKCFACSMSVYVAKVQLHKHLHVENIFFRCPQMFCVYNVCLCCYIATKAAFARCKHIWKVPLVRCLERSLRK